MVFREKIDKLLKIRGIKLWKLAEESKLGTTLEKAYEENREMRERTTIKFLQNLGIRVEWWETGVEPIFTTKTEEELKDFEIDVWKELFKSQAARIRDLEENNRELKERLRRYEEKKA